MKKYKVIKDFGCAVKGDIFEQVDEDSFELREEISSDDSYYNRSMCVNSVVIDALLAEDHIIEVIEEELEECDCCKAVKKLNELRECIDEKLSQYKEDHDNLIKQYNEGDIPQCLKVEADTVYYNLEKLLTAIKELLDE